MKNSVMDKARSKAITKPRRTFLECCPEESCPVQLELRPFVEVSQEGPWVDCRPSTLPLYRAAQGSERSVLPASQAPPSPSSGGAVFFSSRHSLCVLDLSPLPAGTAP